MAVPHSRCSWQCLRSNQGNKTQHMVERGGREQSSSPLCEGDLCLSTWSPMPSQWISAWWQGLCWSLIHNSPGDHLTHACVSPPLPSSWLGFLHVRNQAQLGEYPHEKCSVSLLLGIDPSSCAKHITSKTISTSRRSQCSDDIPATG